MPHLRGWAVLLTWRWSFMKLLFQEGDPGLELGGGSSTAVIASALKSVGAGHLMSIDTVLLPNEVVQTLPDDLLHFVDI